MTTRDLTAEIKVDLGCDVVSLGIKDSSIELKIKEALRKISAYAPFIEIREFSASNNVVEMPEGTQVVLDVLNQQKFASAQVRANDDDQNLFSPQRYFMIGTGMYDPFTYLTINNNIQVLQDYVAVTDWNYLKNQRKLLLSNFPGDRVVVKYARPYESIEEIVDEIVLQYVKEYALALCKIIEGEIRRKLQNAPGAIQLDGDAMVGDGTSEKTALDEKIPRVFQYLRMGIRV